MSIKVQSNSAVITGGADIYSYQNGASMDLISHGLVVIHNRAVVVSISSLSQTTINLYIDGNADGTGTLLMNTLLGYNITPQNLPPFDELFDIANQIDTPNFPFLWDWMNASTYTTDKFIQLRSRTASINLQPFSMKATLIGCLV